MRITTRARVALLIAVAALIVAAIAGSQLAAAGSPRENGGGSGSSQGGGGDVAGICAAPEPGQPAEECDDTIAGICLAPEPGRPAPPCDDTVDGICAAPAGGTADASDCDDMVGSPGDDGKIMDPGDGAEPVEPRPGMAGVRPHSFDHAVVGDDGRSVTVFFWSGVEPCYVLDHVDVEYSANAVTITLYEGHDPDAGDVACIEIALMKKVVVDLDEAVGDREIVDGAA